MAATKHIDFVAAWAEQDAAAPTITTPTGPVTLPATFPAEAMLVRAKWRHIAGAGDGADAGHLEPEQVVEMTDELLGLFVGAARVEEWKSAGLPLARRSEMLERISGLYAADSEVVADDEGEAEAPTAGASSST